MVSRLTGVQDASCMQNTSHHARLLVTVQNLSMCVFYKDAMWQSDILHTKAAT